MLHKVIVATIEYLQIVVLTTQLMPLLSAHNLIMYSVYIALITNHLQEFLNEKDMQSGDLLLSNALWIDFYDCFFEICLIVGRCGWIW